MGAALQEQGRATSYRTLPFHYHHPTKRNTVQQKTCCLMHQNLTQKNLYPSHLHFALLPTNHTTKPDRNQLRHSNLTPSDKILYLAYKLHFFFFRLKISCTVFSKRSSAGRWLFLSYDSLSSSICHHTTSRHGSAHSQSSPFLRFD